MAGRGPDLYIVKPVNLFRLYQPEEPSQLDPSGSLLLEVDNYGTPARSFRFAVHGEDIITVAVPAANISSLPGCEAFSFEIQFRPADIQFRDNTFSEDWRDISELVKKGKALATIDETDHVDEFLDLHTIGNGADHTKGGVIRWCLNVTPTQGLELCLQSLPLALSAVTGRPALKMDACPGMVVARTEIHTDLVLGGPLQGPKPILFAPDSKKAALNLLRNSTAVKTGIFKTLNKFLSKNNVLTLTTVCN